VASAVVLATLFGLLVEETPHFELMQEKVSRP
jgi:hypothetical protein